MKIETINNDTVSEYLNSCTACDVLYNRVYLEISMTADHKHPDHSELYAQMERRAAYGEEGEQIHDGAIRLPNSEGGV